MFNILEKEKIINTFKTIHSWQNLSLININFELIDHKYPIYLIPINSISLDGYIQDDNLQNQFEIGDKEKKIDNLLQNIGYERYKRHFGDKADLSLKLSTISDEISNLYFTKYKKNWFCLIEKEKTTAIYFVGGYGKSISLETLNETIEFLQSL